MRRNKIFQFFYILVLAIFIVFGAALVVRLTELRRGNEFYAQTGETGETISPVPVVLEKDGQGYKTLPMEFPELLTRLSRFAKEYPDAVAWLQLPGTSLDYPVMLGTDNQFYLNHLPDGSKNALGSLFLDCRANEESVHLIVYGHNGSGGKMFGLLKQYESQDYFLEHKTLTVTTVNRVYVCPIFSVRHVTADDDAYELDFGDSDGLRNYIRQAEAESLYPIEADWEDAAGVLTLSTCTGRKGQRFIVQAIIAGGSKQP